MKLLSRALQGAPLASQFSDLVDAARQLNDTQRHAHYHLASQMGREAWAIQYATVRISVGRQAGNSTYIYENATDDCLIVCANWSLASHMRKEAASRGKNPVVVSPTGVATVTSSGVAIQFSTIFVDDASWQTQHTLDAVYAASACGDINQQFILLG